MLFCVEFVGKVNSGVGFGTVSEFVLVAISVVDVCGIVEVISVCVVSDAVELSVGVGTSVVAGTIVGSKLCVLVVNCAVALVEVAVVTC